MDLLYPEFAKSDFLQTSVTEEAKRQEMHIAGPNRTDADLWYADEN